MLSKQAEADVSPNVEPDHVEGTSPADNPPLTAGPNNSFLEEKRKHRLRVELFVLENERLYSKCAGSENERMNGWICRW